MKNLLFLITILLSTQLLSQVRINDPIPPECPGESITYTASPATTAGCTYTWSVTNGVFSNGQTSISGNTLLNVTVTWNNVQATSATSAPKGSLTVQVSGCALPGGEEASNSQNNIVILTLNNVPTGNIDGLSPVPANVTTPRTYFIEKVKFPNTGVTSGWSSSIYADSYQWVIPPGWQLGGVTSDGTTPITNQSHSVSVTPDAFSQGDIKVRAFSECGSGFTSNWSQVKPITRTVAAPAAITGNGGKTFVVCSDITPITFEATAVAGATSYTWTKPAGWSGTSTSNSITLTPSGISGGDITVKANAGMYSSAVTSTSLDLEKLDILNPPNTSGADLVCNSSQQAFTLTNVPSGSTVSWAKSSNLTSVSGQNSNTFTVGGTAANAQGWVQPTISGACGDTTLSKTYLWVGKPVIPATIQVISPQWNSQNQTCPDTILELVSYDVNNDPDITSYFWSIQGATILNGQGTESVFVKIPDHIGTRQLSFAVRAVNSCGNSSYQTLYGTSNPNYGGCGGGGQMLMVVYPNPTMDELSLTQLEGEEFSYSIHNSGNERVVSGISKSGVASSTLKSLPQGIYVLNVLFNDGTTYQQKIVRE
jgi:hypothetical protein